MSNIERPREIPPAGSPIHALVMWVVILASLGIVAAENFHQPASSAIATSSAEAVPNIGLELASRYTVGVHALAVKAHKPLPPDRMGQLVERL